MLLHSGSCEMCPCHLQNYALGLKNKTLAGATTILDDIVVVQVVVEVVRVVALLALDALERSLAE